MENENVPTAPQAGGVDPINPQGQAPITSTDPQAGEGQPKPQRSADDYERMIADLRKENADHRTKRKALEDAEAKRLEERMTAEQKREKQLADYQSQNTELNRQIQELKVTTAIQQAAAQLGIKPVLAARQIDRNALEFDESGNPKNVDDLLKDLLKDFPELAGRPAQAPASTAGGATQPLRSAATNVPAEITAEYIAGLRPADYPAMSADQRKRIAQANLNLRQRR